MFHTPAYLDNFFRVHFLLKDVDCLSGQQVWLGEEEKTQHSVYKSVVQEIPLQAYPSGLQQLQPVGLGQTEVLKHKQLNVLCTNNRENVCVPAPALTSRDYLYGPVQECILVTEQSRIWMVVFKKQRKKCWLYYFRYKCCFIVIGLYEKRSEKGME